MTRIAVRDIIDSRRAYDVLRTLHGEDGCTLGVYGNPVEPDGVYPATADQAIDAWDEDPGLVYVEMAQPVSEWGVPICPTCDEEITADQRMTQSAGGPIRHATCALTH